MKSEKQRNAARLNGAKSRGPATSSGKRNSSQNAIRHGAFAKAILLKTESKSEFAEFAQSLRDEFQPLTAFESTLVDDLITSRWRAMRFAIMEQSLTDHQIDKTENQIRDGVMGADAALEDRTVASLSFQTLADDSRALDLLARYGAHFSRQYLRAHKRLMEVQERRGKTPPPAPVAPNVIPINGHANGHAATSRVPPPAGNEANIEQTERTGQPTENKPTAEEADKDVPVAFAPRDLKIFPGKITRALPRSSPDDPLSSSASSEPRTMSAEAASHHKGDR